MPYYNPPFIKPQLVQKGVPCYLFGGLNMLRGNASGTVADTALASSVGTITVQINQGPIPLVGDFITVWGTAQQSGLFNVTRAVITATSITATTGAGTISFALTGSTQSTTADAGMFSTEIGETSDALSNGYSVQALIQAPQCDSQFTVPVTVTFPSLPTTATVTLQQAVRDIAAEYTDVATVATVTGGAQQGGPTTSVSLQRGYFYRFHASSVTGGTNPTIIAKLGG